MTHERGVRLLHVLTEDVRRGAETSALLVRDELRRRGFAARAVALTSVRSGPRLDVPVLGPSRLGPATLAALRRASADADVVIAHGSSTLPACAIALLGRRVPIVYVNIGDLTYWAGSGPRRWRTMLLLQRTTVVAARSPRSATTLVDRFGVSSRKVHVLPNGRPAELFRPATNPERLRLREELGCPANGAVVAWVGSFSEEKRPDLAVRAVAELTGLTLVMAGDGPLRPEVERLAAELAPGRVRFLGMVDDPACVYRAADLLLVTSDSEGLPGVLIEAGLSGVASVATDVGFVGDVLTDGQTGFVVRPGSVPALVAGLRQALPDAKQLGAQALRRSLADFSMDAVGDRWERLLAGVLSELPHGGRPSAHRA